MPSPLTTLSLFVLTLLALMAAGLALWQLRFPQAQRRVGALQHVLVWACAAGTAGLFLYQALWVHRGWQPLTAHVDGLLLIAALLAGTVLYVQNRPRLEGLAAFGLPLLALILAWAFCASWFTFRLFHLDDNLHPLWKALHLASVYVGTLFAAIAAVGGGTYLYVQHRLRAKDGLRGLGRFASLETLEALIVRTASLGFVLLTLGLVSGLVIETAGPGALGRGWWYSPKVVLATLAWLAYALVMNVRFATAFRGARAAWLSIAGLLLLLATYGVVNALDGPKAEDPHHITSIRDEDKLQITSTRSQTSSRAQGENGERAGEIRGSQAAEGLCGIDCSRMEICSRCVLRDVRFAIDDLSLAIGDARSVPPQEAC